MALNQSRGATAHFILPGAPVKNVQPTQHPLTINFPDGGTIKSTHTCLLDMPWLPTKARVAHIVPGLAHTSLVSISTLCDAGCKVKHNENTCGVYFNDMKVWTCQGEPTTGLWVLPLRPNQSSNPQQVPRPPKQQYCANNAHAMSSKELLIKYLHQALFSPAKAPLIRCWTGIATNEDRKSVVSLS